MKSFTKIATKTVLASTLAATLFSVNAAENDIETHTITPVTASVQVKEVTTVEYDFTSDFNASIENQLNQIDAAINKKIDSSIQKINQTIAEKLASLFN
ncbi:hypothetical protein HJP15_14125 [Pseudoalteromonas sp. NEC-BIFX-2020_002]|uniref:Uncharacterized protein n=2 Tax=Pseudoalteromonas TaxID=53246 RepID=A0A0N0M1I4_9GAMM|nr:MULTISPECIES: hypothetical protein [Pseudoalteromonas]KPH65248.1 hypothetical protein ADS77_02985 [Pseudoalteromonas porphyrae]NMR27298.1 hypothetical protein [Pseudoalteromonas sp. NEC-BIFX-2020_015]NNG44042.1 hypothetical protein [Pseudoalteromonas sp. NEC-BIFX-2020_002]